MDPARTPRLDPAVQTLLRRVRSRLEAHYGPRLAGVVLYGSVARRTEEPESDVDLLILLRGELDYFRELRTLVEILYPLQLESERLIWQGSTTTAVPGRTTRSSTRPPPPSSPKGRGSASTPV